MGTTSDTNGWGEYARHVLAELHRLDESLASVQHDLRAIQIDLATLRVKAALIGAVAGAILSGAVAIFVQFLLRMK